MMSDDSGSSSSEEEEDALQKVPVVVEPVAEVKKKRAYVRKPQSEEAKKVLVDRLALARESKRVKGLERKKAAETPPPPPVVDPVVKPKKEKRVVVVEPKVKRERKAKPIEVPVRSMYEFV